LIAGIAAFGFGVFGVVGGIYLGRVAAVIGLIGFGVSMAAMSWFLLLAQHMQIIMWSGVGVSLVGAVVFAVVGWRRGWFKPLAIREAEVAIAGAAKLAKEGSPEQAVASLRGVGWINELWQVGQTKAKGLQA
jgi:hypothetical protein